MDTNSTTQQNQSLLIWHKPEVMKLTISLDTSRAPGSSSDSDRRLKKDITALKNALQGILSLNGMSYHYDTANHPEMGLSNKPQIGFIAQELEEVYPELVITKENGYKAVNYAPMVAVLVEAIKEQQDIINELQQQVSLLQANIEFAEGK